MLSSVIIARAVAEMPGHLAGDLQVTPGISESLRAEMSLLEAATSQVARGDCARGSLVRCIAVPEVSVNCRRHVPQVKRSGRERWCVKPWPDASCTRRQDMPVMGDALPLEKIVGKIGEILWQPAFMTVFQ